MFVSAYDDYGVKADGLSPYQRKENVELTIRRFFVGKNPIENLEREAIACNINPDPDVIAKLREEQELAEGELGTELLVPSNERSACSLPNHI